VLLGEILEQRVKDDGRALETYDQILNHDPHHRAALEAVARLAESRRNWDKAESALSRLLETASGAAAVELALRLAYARTELGNESGVEEALKRALEADPTNGDVRARLGKLYERTKNWTELAALLASNADLLSNGEEPPVMGV